MGAKRLGLKIEAKQLGGKRLGGKRLGAKRLVTPMSHSCISVFSDGLF